MKVLLSWLNEFADFGDDVETLADEMTALGMPVEETIAAGTKVPGVVVAQVLRTERHPDAEKVHRVYLTTDGSNELHVWCGAFNMKAGDKIPLATLGTKMPDGREIGRRGILGIDSEGMLCSGVELGETRRRTVEGERCAATSCDRAVGAHDADAHRRGADVDGEHVHAASIESRAVARERPAWQR